MPKSIYTLFALALAAMAVLVAGCGSSDDSATATTPPPATKAAFMKQAEKICVKAKADRYSEAVAYRKKHEKELEAMEPIPAEEKIIRAVGLPSIAKQFEEIEAIGIPKGQEEKLEAIFAALKQGLKGAEKDPYAIELEVPSKNPFLKVDDLIRDYGFQECRNVP